VAVPQSIIDQFFGSQGIKNNVVDDYGYSAAIAPSGDFTKFNGKELAIYRMTVLLCTSAGTYINDPDFGIDLTLYAKLNRSTVESIKNEIRNKAARYEKDLVITNIETEVDDVYKTVRLNLYMKYTPTGETASLSFGFIKQMQALAMRAMSED
jgi:hypothetical protein